MYSRSAAILLVLPLAACEVEPPPAAVVPAPAAPLRETFELPDLPARGPASAKVSVVVFMDYACSYCRRLEATLGELEKKYGDVLRVQIVNQPLPMHPGAPLAAIAARAAGEQGRYWEMHARLLEASTTGALDRAALEREAGALGLDLAAFRADLDDPALRAGLDREIELGKKLNVRGTPTLFINGRRVVGAQPYAKLAAIIDEELGGPAAAECTPEEEC